MDKLIADIVKYNQDYFPYEVADTFDDYSGGEGLLEEVRDMVENHIDILISNLTDDVQESRNPEQVRDAQRILNKLKKINSSTSVSATSVFGEPDDFFFTRDDLIDYIEVPLQEAIPDIKGCRAYMDRNVKGQYELSVDIFTYNYEKVNYSF